MQRARPPAKPSGRPVAAPHCASCLRPVLRALPSTGAKTKRNCMETRTKKKKQKSAAAATTALDIMRNAIIKGKSHHSLQCDVTATATAPTVSLCLVPPAAPVLSVSGYAYVAPVPNRVYHCRYVAGSWVFRVRSLDTVQLDTDTGEQYNIGSQIPLQ